MDNVVQSFTCPPANDNSHGVNNRPSKASYGCTFLAWQSTYLCAPNDKPSHISEVSVSGFSDLSVCVDAEFPGEDIHHTFSELSAAIDWIYEWATTGSIECETEFDCFDPLP